MLWGECALHTVECVPTLAVVGGVCSADGLSACITSCGVGCAIHNQQGLALVAVGNDTMQAALRAVEIDR